MIDNRLERIIRQPIDDREKKYRRLYKTAVGSALAVAVTMFMLKYDIMKTDFALRESITDVRRQLEDIQKEGDFIRYQTLQQRLDSIESSNQTYYPSSEAIQLRNTNIKINELSNRIEIIENQQPDYSMLPLIQSSNAIKQVGDLRTEIESMKQEGFIIVEPCIKKRSTHVYEVAGC